MARSLGSGVRAAAPASSLSTTANDLLVRRETREACPQYVEFLESGSGERRKWSVSEMLAEHAHSNDSYSYLRICSVGRPCRHQWSGCYRNRM